MTLALSDIPQLETERLILRGPRLDDYPVMEAFYASDRARFVGGPGNTFQAWRGFAHVAGMWALKGVGSFIITRRGEDRALGMTGPWVPEGWPENEIGWAIWDASLEGTGIAYEAANAARKFAFGTLGWTTAVSYIDAGNERSAALAVRLGAALDPDAKAPAFDDVDIHVYRHPKPEAFA